MEIGKVPEIVLKRSVFQQMHTRREEVLVGAGIGEDCAVVQLAPDEVFVLSTRLPEPRRIWVNWRYRLPPMTLQVPEQSQ